MTADAYLVLRCDGPDETEPDGRCGSEGTWPVRHDPYTHRELRRLLKKHRGWRRNRDGEDICPNHANQQTTPKPTPEPVRAYQPGDQTEISTCGWTA